MYKKTPFFSLLAVMTLLVVSCQSIEQFGSSAFLGVNQASARGPASTFVPPRKYLEVEVGQPLPIESYHVSRNKLGSLEISVNNQPLRSEEMAGETATFPGQLATVQVLREGQPVQTNFLEPKYPTSAWSVSLIWTGHVPGTYILSQTATDAAGHKGETIVQRIEVK